jgi:hypothetical protein
MLAILSFFNLSMSFSSKNTKISKLKFSETVGCADPDICMEVCGSPSGCSNVAYPQLVINLMPPG